MLQRLKACRWNHFSRGLPKRLPRPVRGPPKSGLHVRRAGRDRKSSPAAITIPTMSAGAVSVGMNDDPPVTLSSEAAVSVTVESATFTVTEIVWTPAGAFPGTERSNVKFKLL